jgi:hypothetical protein
MWVSPRSSGEVSYQRDAHGAESPVGGAAVSIDSMGFEEDSAFQNSAELIGAVMGTAGASKLGLRGESIEPTH